MIHFQEFGCTFCVLPWIHLSSMPNGVAKMCCLANKDLYSDKGKLLSFETTPIKDIFNSPEMIDARKKMLNGERVDSCAQCYEEEALGSHSMRLGFNERWFLHEKSAVEGRVEESRQNEYKLESLPWYYDLRQGNLCNLKCRSCGPENSVQIEKEYLKLSEKDQWFSDLVGKRKLDESFRNWFNNENFYNQILRELPNIKKFYFTGGEPTLIEKNFQLLQYCVDNSFAQNIELMFSTNMTHITDRFISLIKNFKYVILNLSIEGVGPEQEYLRTNSRWSTIDSALDKLAQNRSDKILLLLNPVVQACNVLTIDTLFYYAEKLNAKHGANVFYFMPIILNSPDYLDLSVLPAKTRALAASRLLSYLAQSKIIHYDSFFEKRLLQVVKKLQQEHVESEKLVSTFIRFTQALDKERKQSFKNAFPELFDSWHRHSPYFKTDGF